IARSDRAKQDLKIRGGHPQANPPSRVSPFRADGPPDALLGSPQCGAHGVRIGDEKREGLPDIEATVIDRQLSSVSSLADGILQGEPCVRQSREEESETLGVLGVLRARRSACATS